MSLKSKGINAERELVHAFWALGWPCIRVAGSGSSRYPSPDVLAGNSDRMVAIECKVTKEKKKYFPKKEIEDLLKFSELFGAEPWVAIKFQGVGWFFLSLDDLEVTPSSFVASLDLAKRKGLLTEELVGIFKGNV